MKKYGIFGIVIAILLVGGILSFVVVSLPPPDITSQHRLFFRFELIFEDARTFFMFDKVKKAERYLILAKERYEEAHGLTEQVRQAERASSTAINDETYVFLRDAIIIYAEQMIRAYEFAEKNQNKDVLANLVEATNKHIITLDYLSFMSHPGIVYPSAENTRKNVMYIQRRSLEALFFQDRSLAFNVAMRSLETHIERITSNSEQHYIHPIIAALESLKIVSASIEKIVRDDEVLSGKYGENVQPLVERLSVVVQKAPYIDLPSSIATRIEQAKDELLQILEGSNSFVANNHPNLVISENMEDIVFCGKTYQSKQVYIQGVNITRRIAVLVEKHSGTGVCHNFELSPIKVLQVVVNEFPPDIPDGMYYIGLSVHLFRIDPIERTIYVADGYTGEFKTLLGQY